MREIFQAARLCSPSILFLDEIDSILTNRFNETHSGDEASNVPKRILSTLLNEMDGVGIGGEITVVGATNHLDRIDPALLRPGRFDLKVFVHVVTSPE